MRIDGVDVGEDRRLVEPAARVRAAGQRDARRTTSRAPSCLPISTYFITVSSCASLTDGPICVAGSRPSPTRSACARATNSLEELVVHLLVHDDAAGRRAALAGRAESAPQAAFDRQLELRVVHDHDDVLAAHLEVHLLERRRRVLIDERGRPRSIR